MRLSEYGSGMQGKLITAARALLGLSQTELATRADISRATLVNLEKDTGNPTRNSEKAVLDYLKGEGIQFEETADRIGVLLVRRDGDGG